MKIFITGGTGTVGSEVISSLLARQDSTYDVRALARSSSSANKLTGMGATPVLGEITNTTLLTEEATNADIVIYCAFDHSSKDWKAEGDTEASAITAICKGLSASTSPAFEGRRKLLIYCTGFSGFGSNRDIKEATPLPMSYYRGGTDSAVQEYSSASPPSGNGVRGVHLRLAFLVHHEESPHPFLNFFKTEDGQAWRYHKEGKNHWPAASAKDVGRLVVYMIEQQGKIPDGRVIAVHAITEMVAVRDFVGVMAEQSGQQIKPFGETELRKIEGMPKVVLPADPGVNWSWTMDTFGWEPKEKNLLDQIRDAKWFAKA